MKYYKGITDRVFSRRYAEWVDEKYDTNYWRYRPIWFPKNKFSLWDITYDTSAYEKQDDRSLVRRWDYWEGESASLTITTYFLEIKKAYSKRKVKKNKTVYKHSRRP